MRTGPLVFLIAGEPSGDAIGARLMTALRSRSDGGARFVGVGGAAMAAQGLASLFPLSDLTVFGLADPWRRAPTLIRRVRQTRAAIESCRPDAVVSIDAQDFCLAVLRRLRGVDAPLIHYVAPTVWAWRPGRVRAYAKTFDHLMALLPFEPPLFRRAGLPCTFVGHPVLECGADRADGGAFRARRGIAPDTPLLCVLPGSRRSELDRMLKPFAGAARILAGTFPRLEAVVPAAPGLGGRLSAACADWPIPCLVVADDAERYQAMAACDAALAASGTVTLELALAGAPMVVGHRLGPLSYAVVKRLALVRFVTLVNLLLDRAVVPELLQRSCEPAHLADRLAVLLENRQARAEQLAAGREALDMLRPGGPSPSDRAAEVVLDAIAAGARRAARPTGADA